ncbi:hypothetical protein ACJMK2_043541 [Sinanodonta woodiana]|uniref:Tower domain-containing protein n=1 Tax=Sinanodonta woodiana TaxID=1069815 RepID=A0ABD3VX84_SINWO
MMQELLIQVEVLQKICTNYMQVFLGDSSEDWFDQLTQRSLQQKQDRCQSEIFLSPQTQTLQVHKTQCPKKEDDTLVLSVGSTPDIQWTQPKSVSPFLFSQTLTPSPSGWLHPILGCSPDVPDASQSKPVPTPISRNISQLIMGLGTSDSVISWTSSLATPREITITSSQKENLETPVRSKVLARALFSPDQIYTDSEDLVQTLDRTLEEEDLHENLALKVEDEAEICSMETEELYSTDKEYGFVESERKMFDRELGKETEEVVLNTEKSSFVKKSDFGMGFSFIRDQVKAQSEVKEHDFGDQMKQKWRNKDDAGIYVSHVQPAGKMDASVSTEQEEYSMPLFSQDVPSPTLGRSKTLRKKTNLEPCAAQVEMETRSIKVVQDSSIIETLSEFFDTPSCSIKQRRMAPSRSKKRKSEDTENLDPLTAEQDNISCSNIIENTGMPHSILSSRKKQNGKSKTKRVRFSEDCTASDKPKEKIGDGSLDPSHYTDDSRLKVSLSETQPFNSNLKSDQTSVEKDNFGEVHEMMKGKSGGGLGGVSDSFYPILTSRDATSSDKDTSFIGHVAVKCSPGIKSEEGIPSERPNINCNFAEEIFSQISPAVLDEMCSIAQLPQSSSDLVQDPNASPNKSTFSLISSKVEKNIQSISSNSYRSIPNQSKEKDANNSSPDCSNFDTVAEEKTSISSGLKNSLPHRCPRLSRSKVRQFLYPTASQIDASCPRKVDVFNIGKNITRSSCNGPENKDTNSKRILIEADNQKEVKKETSAQLVRPIKQDDVAESQINGFTTCSESTDALCVLHKPEPSINDVHQADCDAESNMKRDCTSPALRIPIVTETQVKLQPDKDSIASLDSHERRYNMEANSGFQTAGGGKISMSKSALKKAEKLLIESVVDTPASVCKDELMICDKEWTEDSIAKPCLDEESSLTALIDVKEIKKKTVNDTYDPLSKELAVTKDVLENSHLSVQRLSESSELGELEVGSNGDKIKVSQKGSDSVHDDESKERPQFSYDEIDLPRNVVSFSDMSVNGFKSASGKDIPLNKQSVEKVKKLLIDKSEGNEEKDSDLLNFNNYSTLKMHMPSKAICAGTEAFRNAQRLLSSSSNSGLPRKNKNHEVTSNANGKLFKEMDSSAESQIIKVDNDSIYAAQKSYFEKVHVSHGRNYFGVSTVLRSQKLISERYPQDLPYEVDQNAKNPKSEASPDDLVHEYMFDELSHIDGLHNNPRSSEMTASLCKGDISNLTKADELTGLPTTDGKATTQGVALIDTTESLHSDVETIRHSVAGSHTPKTLPKIMSERYKGSFLPSSDQPVGFCTAGGKKLAMSDASLFMAAKLFSDSDNETASELQMDNDHEQRESVTFHTVNSMKRSCGKTNCIKETKVPDGRRDKIFVSAAKDMKFLNESMDFQSGSGKKLAANEMAHLKARSHIKEDREVAEPMSVDVPSAGQLVVFSTAGGKRLAASEAAIFKAKTLLSDDPSCETISDLSSITSLNILESADLLTMPDLNTISCTADGDRKQEDDRSDGVHDLLEELLSSRSKINESGDAGRFKCNTSFCSFSSGRNVPQGFRPFKPPRKIASAVSEVEKKSSNSLDEKSDATISCDLKKGITDVSACIRNSLSMENSDLGKNMCHKISRNLKPAANDISASNLVSMMNIEKPRSATGVMDTNDGEITISKDTEQHICEEDKKSNDNLMDQIFADEFESSQMFSPRSGKVITHLKKELESHPWQSEGDDNHIKEQHSSSREFNSMVVDMKPEDFDADMNDPEEYLSVVDLEGLQTGTDGQVSQSVLEQKTSHNTLPKISWSKCLMCKAVIVKSVLEFDTSTEVLCSDCSNEANHIKGTDSFNKEWNKDILLNKLSDNGGVPTFVNNKTSISTNVSNSNVLVEDSALLFSQTGGSEAQDIKSTDIKLQNGDKNLTMEHNHSVISSHVQSLNKAVVRNQSPNEILTQIPATNELIAYQNQKEAVTHMKSENEAMTHINRDIETLCQRNTEGRLKLNADDHHLESDLLESFFESQFDFTDADLAQESCMANVLFNKKFDKTSKLDSCKSSTVSSGHSQDVTICLTSNESLASSSKDQSSAAHLSPSEKSQCAFTCMDIESNVNMQSGERVLVTSGELCISKDSISHTKQIYDSSELQRGNGSFFHTASDSDMDVSKNALSCALQIRDSSGNRHENEFLFKTAGGKTVCVSEKSMSHVKQSLNSFEIQSGNNIFTGKNVSVSDMAFLQAKNIIGSLKLNSGTESLIETARGGSNLSMSEKAVSHTKDVLDSSDLLSGNESIFKTTGVSKKEASHAKQTQNSSDLQGGNNSNVRNVSDKDADVENVSSHARLIFNFKEIQNGSGSVSETAGDESYARQTIESTNLQNKSGSLFQTAGGKSVKISSKALSHAKQILDSSIMGDETKSAFRSTGSKSVCLSENTSSNTGQNISSRKSTFNDEKYVNVSEKSTDLKNESIGLQKTTAGKSVNVSERGLSRASQTQNEGDSLFITAGGKSVTVSEKALIHAKKLNILDSSEQQYGVPSLFNIATGTSANALNKDLLQCQETVDSGDILSVGQPLFMMAGGKSVNLSAKALLHAKKLLDSSSMEPEDSSAIKIADNISAKVSNKTSFPAGRTCNSNGSDLVTVGEKSVSITEKALLQARQTHDTLDKKIESVPQFKFAVAVVDMSRKVVSLAKQSRDSSYLQIESGSLFQTAGGKCIGVSEKALAQAKKNINFSDLQSENGTFVETVGGKSVSLSEKDFAYAKESLDSSDLQDGNEDLFPTIGCKSVNVLDNSLLQMRQKLDSSCLQSDIEGGKSFVVSEKNLLQAGQITDSTNMQNERECLFKTDVGVFTTVLETSQIQTRQAYDSLDLECEGGSLFKTAGGKSVSITDKALTYARQTLDSAWQSEGGSLFKTAGGKLVGVSDNALLLAKQTLDSPDVQCENSLFKTAGGKSVNVSDKGLLQARQAFDSLHVPNNNGTLFKTAGGQPVSVSEKNISHAKQTLSSSLSDEVSEGDSRSHHLKDRSAAGIHSADDCVPQEYLDLLAQMKENLNANSLKRKQETLDTVKNEDILSDCINDTRKTDTTFTRKEDLCRHKRHLRLDGDEEFVAKSFEKQPRKRIRIEDSIVSIFSDKRENDRMLSCKLQVSTPEGVLLDRRCASMRGLKPVYSKQHVQDPDKYSGSSLDVNKDHPALNAGQKNSFKTPYKSCSNAAAITCSDATVLKSDFKISVPVFRTNVQQQMKKENASHLSRQRDMECESVSTFDLPMESTKCPLLDARRHQEEIIAAKQKQLIRPVAGRLFQQKRNIGRIRLKDAIHFGSAKRTDQELLSHGVSRSILGVRASNAGEYRFTLSDFYSSEVGHVLVGDGAYLVPDDSGTAGKQEFARAFQTLEGVDPKLVNEAWIYNHYRWIVWKLAAYEVVSPSSMAGRCLIPETVMLQLKYRYDVEIDRCHRSALKKIIERDDACGKRMVLCVSGIEHSEILLKEGDQSNTEDNKGKVLSLDPNVMLELTDGWYCIKSKLDLPLANLVMHGRIQIGQKMCIAGAELVGSKEACTPLEIPDSLLLKICANSCRSAPWDSRLGFQSEPSPLCVPLTGLYGEGGLVGAIDVVVVRKYPLMYMEKLHEGGCVFRNETAEMRERQNHENQQQDNMERFYQNMEQQMEKEDKEERRCVSKQKWTRQEVSHLQTGQELYEAMMASLNPDSLEFLLTQQQMELLHEYKRQVQDEKHSQIQERLRKAWADQQENVKSRNVTPVLKFRIASCARRDLDNQITTILTVWRPSSEIMMIEEGQRYRIYSLTASAPRSKYIGHDVQLTAVKNTRYQRKKIDENFLDLVYEPREVSTVEDLRRKPAYGEVDFVGMVIKVVLAAQESGQTPDIVYCADYQGNALGIKFWTGIKGHGVEDLLVEGRLVCICNLMDKSSFRSHVLLLLEASTEFTSFTNQPQNSTQRIMLEKMQNSCKKKNFLASAQEKLEDLITRKHNTQSRITPQKSTTSTSTLDQSTPISRRKSTESTPDMSSDNTKKSMKRSIQQTKMAKLMSYGSPGVLSPLLPCIPKSVFRDFKPPVFKGNNTPK